MQDDWHQYHAANGENKYTYFKAQQIKILQSVFENISQITEQLQNETAFKPNPKILKLEAIALLHGIADINYYLSQPTNNLINQVREAYAENWRQTPFDLIPGNLASISKPPETATKLKLNWANYQPPSAKI